MDPDTRESGINGEGNKQILAPSEGPRENLINTAVKFLQNPKVMSSPLYQKKAFLEKKGLTQEEIAIAVERAGVKETNAEIVPSQPGPTGMMGGGPNSMAAPVLAPIPPQSMWARARDVTVTTVIVAGVSYGLYQLFERYVRPLLWGQTVQERKMEKLERQLVEIQKSVSDSLSEMTKTLSAIQSSLQSQHTHNYNSSSNERTLADLKSDIASLKGLLLSRSQFPPAPSTSMILPSWQRGSASSSAPVTSKSAHATTGSVETLPETTVVAPAAPGEPKASESSSQSSSPTTETNNSEVVGDSGSGGTSLQTSEGSANSDLDVAMKENREDLTNSDTSTETIVTPSLQDEPGNQAQVVVTSGPQDAS